MMELDIIYRLSMLVGFLTAGFIAILIGAAIVALRCWYRSTMKDLDRMIDDLETMEESANENEKS